MPDCTTASHGLGRLFAGFLAPEWQHTKAHAQQLHSCFTACHGSVRLAGLPERCAAEGQQPVHQRGLAMVNMGCGTGLGIRQRDSYMEQRQTCSSAPFSRGKRTTADGGTICHRPELPCMRSK
jgi:hypothetical protein